MIRCVRREKYCAPYKHAGALQFRMLAVEIVDDDQVEIGGRGHFTTAEPAERQHGDLLPLNAAVQLDEIFLDGAAERADQQIGQPGERFAGLFGRHRAGQNARADQEHLLLGKDSDAVEEVLVRARLLQRAVETGGKLRVFRQGAEEARVDHRVHHFRQLREDVGEPGRGAEHLRDQRDQVRILPQQGDQAPTLHAGEKPVERHQRRVRIGGAREMMQQDRRQFGQFRAREGSFQSAMIAARPVAHQGRSFEQDGGSPSRSAGRAFRDRRLQAETIAAAGRLSFPAHFRTTSHSDAARCADARAARRQRRRDPESRRTAQTARAPSRSAGSTWVCSSATICNRFSITRRKR